MALHYVVLNILPATVALRPNADVSLGWTVVNGGATQAWQVLDDNVEHD